MDIIRKIDYLGAFLSIAGVTLLLVLYVTRPKAQC
jgi:hypothetical protein